VFCFRFPVRCPEITARGMNISLQLFILNK
jgi:hypothetical protein